MLVTVTQLAIIILGGEKKTYVLSKWICSYLVYTETILYGHSKTQIEIITLTRLKFFSNPIVHQSWLKNSFANSKWGFKAFGVFLYNFILCGHANSDPTDANICVSVKLCYVWRCLERRIKKVWIITVPCLLNLNGWLAGWMDGFMNFNIFWLHSTPYGGAIAFWPIFFLEHCCPTPRKRGRQRWISFEVFSLMRCNFLLLN